MNTNIFSTSPIEMYELIISRNMSKFPNGYLDKNACKEIIRYVALNKLNMSRDEIAKNIDLPFLRRYHIISFRNFFHSQLHELVSYCFPELDIQPWEMKRVSNNFWESEENRKKYILWVIKKENIDITKISSIQRINADMIRKYSGNKPLKYSGGLYPLIKLATGDTIKEWQFIKINKWDTDKAISAIKWLIEEKLQWTDEEIYNNLTSKVFSDNYLGALLNRFCHHSPIYAINLAYPGKFQKLKYSK